MKKVMLVAAFAPFVLASAGIANAASVPCEDMLKQLRDAEKTATMNDADKSAVADLEAKGVERCKADDDKRADKFFTDAIKIVSKK